MKFVGVLDDLVIQRGCVAIDEQKQLGDIICIHVFL